MEIMENRKTTLNSLKQNPSEITTLHNPTQEELIHRLIQCAIVNSACTVVAEYTVTDIIIREKKNLSPLILPMDFPVEHHLVAMHSMSPSLTVVGATQLC